jgi:hypothetical protein
MMGYLITDGADFIRGGFEKNLDSLNVNLIKC